MKANPYLKPQIANVARVARPAQHPGCALQRGLEGDLPGDQPDPQRPAREQRAAGDPVQARAARPLASAMPNGGGWRLPSSPSTPCDSPRPQHQLLRRRRRSTKLQRRQTRLAWLLLVPALAVVAFVAIYPLGKTIYQSFTDQEFLALEPTKWVGLQNYRELLARHDLPRRRLDDGQVHADHGRLRVRARAGHRPRRQLELQGPRRHARGDARPVGDPDRRRRADVEVDAQTNSASINDAGTRLHLLSHPHAWISDPSTALGAVCAVDIWKTTPFVALLLLAGLQVIPQRSLRGRRGRRRQPAAAVLEDHAAAARARDLRHADLPDARRAARVRRLLRVLREPARTRRRWRSTPRATIVGNGYVGYGAAISMAIFLVIALFVVIYVTFQRVALR